MKEYLEIIANNKESISLKDLMGYKLIGKGGDGSVFQVTADRCIKIFEKEETKTLELSALQLGQPSPVFPRLYEHGPNFIVMEYVKGISLPQYLKEKNQLPESIVEKILAMLVDLKKVGFERHDTEVRHILFNAEMEVKIIDLKKAFGGVRSTPTTLLTGLKKRGFLCEFMQHVKTLSPSLYKEWNSQLPL